MEPGMEPRYEPVEVDRCAASRSRLLKKKRAA